MIYWYLFNVQVYFPFKLKVDIFNSSNLMSKIKSMFQGRGKLMRSTFGLSVLNWHTKTSQLKHDNLFPHSTRKMVWNLQPRGFTVEVSCWLEKPPLSYVVSCCLDGWYQKRSSKYWCLVATQPTMLWSLAINMTAIFYQRGKCNSILEKFVKLKSRHVFKKLNFLYECEVSLVCLFQNFCHSFLCFSLSWTSLRYFHRLLALSLLVFNRAPSQLYCGGCFTSILDHVLSELLYN